MKKVFIEDCTIIHGDAQQIVPNLAGQYSSIVADPPYGMGFVSNRSKTRIDRPIENDENAEMLNWVATLLPQHSAYIFCRWANLQDVPVPKSFITWVKNNHSMGDLKHEHARKTESILFYPGPEHHWPGKRPTDVVEFKKVRPENHPTEKPVDLMEEIVGWAAGTVLDPFMGSGTTGVACVRAGRKFIGVEIDEGYFEKACERIAEEYRRRDK